MFFALKPRIEIAVRILLVAIVLFNGLAPTVGAAKSLTEQNKSVDVLETKSQEQEIEVADSWSNFARPISRIGERPSSIASTQVAQPTVESLPIPFIENVGQFNENELFQAQIAQGSIHIAKNAIWISTIDNKSEIIKDKLLGNRDNNPEGQIDSAQNDITIKGVNLRLSFIGSDSPQSIGFNSLDTKVSYFLDKDPANWYPDVPVFGG